MEDRDVVVIFSSFDDKIGQVPLVHVGLDDDEALKACNQISMSILAAVSNIHSSEDFQGESIVPLVEFGLVAVVSYFFMSAEHLPEPSFSFVAYAVPLEQKTLLYSVMKGLMTRLSEVANKVKSSVTLTLPLQENSIIPEESRQAIMELVRPLDDFKDSETSVQDFGFLSERQLDFVEAIAFAAFKGDKMELHVPFSHGIESQHVEKIAFRVILSLLTRLAKTKKKGEAIIPDVESNKIIFSYFFPINDDVVGIIFIFAKEDHKMILYRSAPLLANEIAPIAEQLATMKSVESLSFSMRNRLMGLYYVNAAIEDHFKKLRTITPEESNYLKNPKGLFKFKNVEKLITALITGHPLILVSKYFFDSQDLAYLLARLTPHRDVTLVRKNAENLSTAAFQRWNVVYVPRDFAKKIPKEVTVVDIDKKKVSSPLSSPYVKKIVKQVETLGSLEEIVKLMKNEVTVLLDQVSQLVEVSKMEDEVKAKDKIDKFLLSLPDSDMFDVIKEMAISFNPVLVDLINEKAVYVIRRDLWGI